jgi:hypothetical protein
MSRSGEQYTTSRQIKDYLLFESCEVLVRTGGEDWVMKNCYRGRGKFSMRDAIKEHPPIARTKDDGFIYRLSDFPELDPSKLIHFGASVFWRAATHLWRIHNRTVNIDLGPYTERLREFLLGAPFPAERVNLFLRMSTLEEFCLFLGEPVSRNMNGYVAHQFSLLGLRFILTVGKHLRPDFTPLSLAPGGHIGISPRLDEADADDLTEMYKACG